MSNLSLTRPDPVVVRPNGFRLLFMGILVIGFGIGGLAVALAEFGKLTANSLIDIAQSSHLEVVVLASIIVELAGVYLVVRAILRRPSLVLDERGWTTTGLGGISIPWECVDTVCILCIETPNRFRPVKNYYLGVVSKNVVRLIRSLPEDAQRATDESLQARSAIGLVAELLLPHTCKETSEALLPLVSKWVAWSDAQPDKR